mgnify:FL=1
MLLLAAVLSAASCTKDPKEIDRDSVETTAGSGNRLEVVTDDGDGKWGKLNPAN